MRKPLEILYVDDEEDIRTIVQLALGMDPDLTVVLAESGEDALRRIGRDGWMPDLAILDVMMPGMTGTELMAALRARTDAAGIPVVFITASARTSEIERLSSLGAIGVISKPFDVLSLPSQVRSLYDAARG